MPSCQSRPDQRDHCSSECLQALSSRATRVDDCLSGLAMFSGVNISFVDFVNDRGRSKAYLHNPLLLQESSLNDADVDAAELAFRAGLHYIVSGGLISSYCRISLAHIFPRLVQVRRAVSAGFRPDTTELECSLHNRCIRSASIPRYKRGSHTYLRYNMGKPSDTLLVCSGTSSSGTSSTAEHKASQ